MTRSVLPPPTCKTASRPYKRTSAAAFQADPPDADDPLLSFAPYVHEAPRRNSLTPERQQAFIAALAASGIVTQAAREIGASLEALYKLRNRKGAEGFAAAWELALDRGLARLQDCALERAIQGEERPVLTRSGEVGASWTRYDTGLITFLLRQGRGGRLAGKEQADIEPGGPVYERLKREWEEERQRRQEAEAQALTEEDDVFLRKLNARCEEIRNKAIAHGVMVLDEKGVGKFVGLDDDDDHTDPSTGAWATRGVSRG